jgi:hypothetical protein
MPRRGSSRDPRRLLNCSLDRAIAELACGNRRKSPRGRGTRTLYVTRALRTLRSAVPPGGLRGTPRGVRQRGWRTGGGGRFTRLYPRGVTRRRSLSPIRASSSATKAVESVECFSHQQLVLSFLMWPKSRSNYNSSRSPACRTTGVSDEGEREGSESGAARGQVGGKHGSAVPGEEDKIVAT